MTYYNATFRDANLISYIERTTETNSFILRKRIIGKCLSFFIHFVVPFCAYYWHVGIHLYDVRIYNYNDVYVKPVFLLMLSTCTCACFDCFASWFIIGLNSIQCVYIQLFIWTLYSMPKIRLVSIWYVITQYLFIISTSHVIWNLVFICPFESYCRYYLKNINNRCQKRHIA